MRGSDFVRYLYICRCCRFCCGGGGPPHNRIPLSQGFDSYKRLTAYVITSTVPYGLVG